MSNTATLLQAYHHDVQHLQAIFASQVRAVQQQRISSAAKRQRKSQLTNDYQRTLQRLKSKLQADLQAAMKPPSIAPTPSQYGLLVGINYRNTPNELQGCIQDVHNVRTWLQDVQGFPSSNIVTLTDDTDVKPTRMGILNALQDLLSHAVPGDRLFFLYSGHGTCTADVTKDEIDGQDELIVPLNANTIHDCILDDELYTLVQTHLKKHVQLVALFDSCFSGTILDLKYQWLPTKKVRADIVPDTLGQVVVISGCKDSQTSADAQVTYQGQSMSAGAMTFSFLETQATNTNHTMSLQTILTDMRSLLRREGYDQIPQCTSGQTLDITQPLVI